MRFLFICLLRQFLQYFFLAAVSCINSIYLSYVFIYPMDNKKRLSAQNEVMIFFWWFCGALVLSVIITITAISAGVKVQVSADLARGCAAVSVNILNTQVIRIKIFESGGELYYIVNGGRLRKIRRNIKKKDKKEQSDRAVKSGNTGKLSLRSIYVNAAVGAENAAATAVMSAALGNVILYFLQKYVRTKDCKSAVNAEYGESNVKINAGAVAGWGTLFTLGHIANSVRRS